MTRWTLSRLIGHDARIARVERGDDSMRDAGAATAAAVVDVPVAGVCADSRRVTAGDLLVVRTTDGHAMVERVRAARERGASAVLLPALDDAGRQATASAAGPDLVRIEVGPGVAVASVGATLAERHAGDPSRRLDLVAVTGTNGKTTVAWLVRGILARRGPFGFIGTVSVHDGVTAAPAGLTTPDATDLSRWLARMVANGCTGAACEASSHGLAQGRLDGVRIAAAIFTNLSGDHLDYHGDMNAYAAAKRRVFELLHPDGVAVVNIDDPRGPEMITASAARVVTTSVRGAAADVTATVRDADLHGSRIALRGPWGDAEVDLPLVGPFNVSNAVQAAAVAHALEVPIDDILAGLATATAPPGRLEPVGVPGVPGAPGGGGAAAATLPRVLVDYAHTDDALDSMLRAVRPLRPSGGRLWCVFGCGGDRDRTKRPRMAAAAARHADVVVLTSDNPRTEDPMRIIDDARAGVDASTGLVCEVDRRAAIRLAIEGAGPDDVVVIAGKGHETEQIVGTERRPFDDRTVAAEMLAARAMGGAARPSDDGSASPASPTTPATPATPATTEPPTGDPPMVETMRPVRRPATDPAP